LDFLEAAAGGRLVTRPSDSRPAGAIDTEWPNLHESYRQAQEV